MTTRENIIAALDGLTPNRTPLTFYSWMANDLFLDPWNKLYDLGLGICHHIGVFDQIEHGVKDSKETKYIGSDKYEYYIKETPLGTVTMCIKNGWHYEYWIKSDQDYKIMTWIVNNTELVPRYERFEQGEELVKDKGVSVILASRTPAMVINVDWAGTEKFCMDVALDHQEMMKLYEARKKLFIKETELIAKGPGKYVKWLENLTISMLGPSKYSQLLIPVYQQCVPIYESCNKRVMVHYDGALNVIKDQIAKAPFHMIESLTEAPEGDMDYAQCRQAWPDKVFWANINVDLYYQPENILRQAVIDKRNRAGKQAFLFEISEDLPSNWTESIPVVLDTLAKIN